MRATGRGSPPEVPQRRPRFETELTGQVCASAGVHVECVCLASAAILRQHQLASESFAAWVLGEEGLKLADQRGVLTSANPPPCGPRAR